MAIDIHQEVTDQIIAAIEAGATSSGRPWQNLVAMPTRVTGDEYQGINALMLALTAHAKRYASPTWMTFNQAKQLGGSVRRGERSTIVVFYKRLEITEENDAGDEETRGIPMLRHYRVFNVDQIDGLPDDKFAPLAPVLLPAKARDEAAEAALRSSGARIAEDGGNHAFYRPATDSIHMPRFEAFHSAELYLATLAHELCHWTGAPHRLDRPMANRFGSKDYAVEELIAEIGAAFVCARLGIASGHIDDHAAYVASWLQALRNDKKFIFKAAASAQRAADMVLANVGDADRGRKPAEPTPAPQPIARTAAPAQFALAF